MSRSRNSLEEWLKVPIFQTLRSAALENNGDSSPPSMRTATGSLLRIILVTIWAAYERNRGAAGRPSRHPFPVAWIVRVAGKFVAVERNPQPRARGDLHRTIFKLHLAAFEDVVRQVVVM